MQNLSSNRLSTEQGLFIEEFAALLVAWNMPSVAARLYGYLLLQNEPVSLDDIAADLEIGKSSACVAAKELEQQGNARRVRERGTKRVLYVMGDDPGAPLHKHVALLGMMAELLSKRTNRVASGRAAQRMNELARFDDDLRAAMASVVIPPARAKGLRTA
jgi:hypothetical protein